MKKKQVANRVAKPRPQQFPVENSLLKIEHFKIQFPVEHSLLNIEHFSNPTLTPQPL